MLGLDTNVLVRYLVRDEEAQFYRARRLIERETEGGCSILISLLVLLETEWVLRSRYELTKSEIHSVFSTLLEVADLAFEDEPSIEQALYQWSESTADFADCLLAARHRQLGCEATVTFDTKAAKVEGFLFLTNTSADKTRGR